MGRKKKLVNNTNIPQYAIECFARCVFEDIRIAYGDKKIQKEFAEWQAEQEAKKAELKLHTKKRELPIRQLSSACRKSLLIGRLFLVSVVE